MSHFLTSLLDRAAQKAPVLERRRPSLFEPIPPAAEPRLKRSPQPDAHEGSAPHPARETIVDQRIGHPGPVLKTRASPEPKLSRLPDHPQQAPHPVLASPTAMPRLQQEHDAAIESKSPHCSPASATGKNLRSERPPLFELDKSLKPASREGDSRKPANSGVTQVLTLVREPQQLRTEIAQLNRVNADPTPQRSESSGSFTRKRTPEVRTRQNSDPPPLMARKSSPYRSSGEPPTLPSRLRILSRRPPSPSPSPVMEVPAPIQVTIGRIEVRATTPSARPPAARPPSPSKLSLDEYLRQRTGGGS